MSQDLFSDSQLFAPTQDTQTNGRNGDEDVSEEERVSQSSNSDQNRRRSGQKREKLLTTDLPKEEIDKYKQVFVQIHKKTKMVAKNTDIVETTRGLTEQLDRADKCLRSGGVNENMTLDAKCIVENASVTNRLVKSLQTDSKVFDAMDFANKLLTAMNADPIDDNNEDPNQTVRANPSDWVEFGRNYCRFHRFLPSFDFIYGSFDSSNETPQQKQVKPRARHPKPVLSAQVEATQIDPNSKATEDSTPQEVEHILKIVKKLEAKNPCLPFIDVMVNPNSMSETVENIFHTAFLVKDGMARIVADEEDGLPTIASIDNANIDVSEAEKGFQSVLSFSVKDWKYWTERFDIKKAAIRHQKKATKDVVENPPTE